MNQRVRSRTIQKDFVGDYRRLPPPHTGSIVAAGDGAESDLPGTLSPNAPAGWREKTPRRERVSGRTSMASKDQCRLSRIVRRSDPRSGAQDWLGSRASNTTPLFQSRQDRDQIPGKARIS